jgi:hypothetical protein
VPLLAHSNGIKFPPAFRGLLQADQRRFFNNQIHHISENLLEKTVSGNL